ncbi:MAG: prolipoprotein diacylglyceryl transferase [Candidatus Gracilibacteria bacterium]|nr:prolipoprotein diacylglyceryl transferase [Candidatus Gracilibacteria bacterium]
MFPFFELFGINIYSFGLALTMSFFLFLWMLKKLCHRFGINETFFLNRLIWYFLSVFFFSRLFYIISQWSDFKFIKNPIEFFIMSDYNFSLVGAMFGFLVMLFTTLKIYNLKSGKYIDASVLAFLFVAIFAYIGAFMGGQVYGKDTSFGIEMLYTNPFSPVPYEVPIFPLALFYSFFSLLLFSGFYILALFVKIRGLIGYLAIFVFSSLLLILEVFSGKIDFFKTYIGINFTQFVAIFFIIFAGYQLYTIYKSPKKYEAVD